MKIAWINTNRSWFLTAFLIPAGLLMCTAQEQPPHFISFEAYVEGFLEADEIYLSTLEEWQDAIDQWLEKPLCINQEEADLLAEYKIISLYQLNKLKEYRLIFGNLLSVYELEYIDGWDLQTARKVMPLVTVKSSDRERAMKKFNFNSLRHNLVIKAGTQTEPGKGYLQSPGKTTGSTEPYYSGSPARFAIRYDLDFRNRIVAGLRMEKDPGEPLLLYDSSIMQKIKLPDLLSGYLHVKKLGPLQSVILGNYRVSFGYGLNISGGQSGIKGRNGFPGMAGKISPHTSTSETGFFRGIAMTTGIERISLTCFYSFQNHDGTSVETDSLTGKPVSFSSIDKSGLHRSLTEISGRKNITEKVLGGFIVYRNNWLKAGIISIYQRFNAFISKSHKAYSRFNLTGHENMVSGISTTVWLPKLQFLAEAAVSRSRGKALLTGMQVTPVPGALISLIYRKFDTGFQNWHGSGFLSYGANSGEAGIQFKARMELPGKYLVELILDQSRSVWVSYDLAAPSRQHEVKTMVEKSWYKAFAFAFSFKFLHSAGKDALNSGHICRPEDLLEYRLRLEGRIDAIDRVRLKSRIECKLTQGLKPGWLLFQDIAYENDGFISKIWLRACLFDIMDFNNSIYAYENDVLYDFTSFMHYGKGLRGVLLFRLSPAGWLTLWLRFSTVYYTNKNIGTGWDEIDGNRQQEVEMQLRFRWPGQ